MRKEANLRNRGGRKEGMEEGIWGKETWREFDIRADTISEDARATNVSGRVSHTMSYVG